MIENETVWEHTSFDIHRMNDDVINRDRKIIGNKTANSRVPILAAPVGSWTGLKCQCRTHQTLRPLLLSKGLGREARAYNFGTECKILEMLFYKKLLIIFLILPDFNALGSSKL